MKLKKKPKKQKQEKKRKQEKSIVEIKPGLRSKVNSIYIYVPFSPTGQTIPNTGIMVFPNLYLLRNHLMFMRVFNSLFTAFSARCLYTSLRLSGSLA